VARKHGMSGTPTHSCWRSMLARCRSHPNYAGRVKVCKRWLKFENFLADMGERPPGKTLDRYPDNEGDYKPGNVRWASPKEQMNNRRPSRIKERRQRIRDAFNRQLRKANQ
jgi:hypothetical protein